MKSKNASVMVSSAGELRSLVQSNTSCLALLPVVGKIRRCVVVWWRMVKFRPGPVAFHALRPDLQTVVGKVVVK